MHTPDGPHPEEGAKPPKRDVEDQLWTFIPIIVGAAAVCLLMFFFVTPSFEAADGSGAKSARPGAVTATAKP